MMDNVSEHLLNSVQDVFEDENRRFLSSIFVIPKTRNHSEPERFIAAFFSDFFVSNFGPKFQIIQILYNLSQVSIYYSS
jgi:hypothetical protein